MRILFIGPTRIGDAVLSSGLLHHLSCTHPDARLTVACGVPAAPLFAAVPNLERLLPMTKRPHGRHWLDLWRRVAGTRWSLVVDLRRSPLPWLLAARKRALAPRPRAAGEHKVVSLGRTLGLGDAPPAPHLWTKSEDESAADRLIPAGGPVLAIGPTANWKGKTWRAEGFVETVARLTAAQGEEAILPDARVAVFGGPGEREAAAPVLDGIPDSRRIDLVDRVSLPVVAACLTRCALYVGNDSGLMHMSAASGTPTLGLFGPSRPELYAPWGPRGAWVRTPESFEQLIGRPGYDHRTTGTMMDSLSSDTVVDAAVALWQRTRGDRAA